MVDEELFELDARAAGGAITELKLAVDEALLQDGLARNELLGLAIRDDASVAGEARSGPGGGRSRRMVVPLLRLAVVVVRPASVEERRVRQAAGVRGRLVRGRGQASAGRGREERAVRMMRG